ncbi:hypothetical protein [Lactobacillus melliventris]|uniref:hypothetical protein n=1 Tax=Lactobacillus melliventris TaxID=1218507 RepID=UPI0015E89FA7|nr:hypothetical protein [Lactobacillus melliventris]
MNFKKYKKLGLGIEIFSIALMVICKNITALILGFIFLLGSMFILLRGAYFNGKEKFDSDSLYICLSYFSPIFELIIFSIIGVFIKDAQKYLKSYTIFSACLIIFFCLFFWFIYFLRCKRQIIEIKKDKNLFKIEMIGTLLATLLVFAAATIFIISFPGDDNTVKTESVLGIKSYISLTYQLFNIFINSIILFIDMFSYVRSEIDEFNKEEKEKQEQEKEKQEQEKEKQEQIESIIKEKRKILKKEKQEQEKEKYKFDFYNYE